MLVRDWARLWLSQVSTRAHGDQRLPPYIVGGRVWGRAAAALKTLGSAAASVGEAASGPPLLRAAAGPNHRSATVARGGERWGGQDMRSALSYRPERRAPTRGGRPLGHMELPFPLPLLCP